MEPDDLSDDGSDGGDDTDSLDSGDGESPDSADGDTGNSSDPLEGLENEIYDDLTDEQKAIRNKELKDKFIELYNLIKSFKQKVEYINKNSDNMQIIIRVSNALDKLADMTLHYITKTYHTKTYIENKSDFYYALWCLDRIVVLIESIAPEEPVKK